MGAERTTKRLPKPPPPRTVPQADVAKTLVEKILQRKATNHSVRNKFAPYDTKPRSECVTSTDPSQ